jgi:hypothetical protein
MTLVRLQIVFVIFTSMAHTINLGGTELKKNSDGDIEFKSGSNFKKLVISELEFDDGTNRKKFKIDSGRIKSFDSSGVSDTADKISLSSNTTNDLGEGSSNLYFTTARARSSFSASTGIAISDGAISAAAVPNSSLTNSSVTINSNSLSLGGTLTLDTDDIGEGSTNLYYTTARARGAISVSGNALSYNSSTGVLTANYEESPSFTGNVTVSGTISSGAITSSGLITADDLALEVAGAASELKFIQGGAFRSSLSYNNATGLMILDNKYSSVDIYAGSGGTSSIRGRFNTSGLTVTGTISSGDIFSTGNITADGYLQAYSFLYTRNNLRVLNAAGTGWKDWAVRSNGNYNLDVGTISSGAITSTGAIQGASFSDGTISGITFIDEDSFSTNSATRVPTQQSIKAYVDAQVAGVVDTAPAALDTLNELAAALGDDANFSTTTSTALGNRLRVDINNQGLTGTQQANAITNLGITATKAELNFVDGVTSNIQTQLDGKQATGNYLTTSTSFGGDVSGTYNNIAVANNSHEHSQLYENGTIDFGASYVQWTDQSSGGTGLDGAAPRNPAAGWYHNLIFNHANSNGYYSQIATGLNTSDIYFTRVQNGTAQDWQRIFADDYHPNADKWTTARTINLGGDLTGNVSIDGSANVTLTAAVVDDSHNHTHSDGNFTVNGLLQAGAGSNHISTAAAPFRWQRSSSGQTGQDDNVSVYVDDSNIYFTHNNDDDGDASGFNFRYTTGGTATNLLNFSASTMTYKGNAVWHAGNDGPGSGLDADKLDGQQGSYYAPIASPSFTTKITTPSIHNSEKIAILNGSSAQGIRVLSLYAGTTYASDGSASGMVDTLNGYRVQGAQVIDSSGNWVGGGNISEFTNNSGYVTASTTSLSNYLRKNANDTFGSTSANQTIRFNCNSGQYIASGGSETRFPIEIFSPTANGGDAGLTFHISGDYAGFFGLASDWNDLAWGGWSVGGSTKHRIWHSGNDGSGSGLDADLLDGKSHENFGATLATYGTTAGSSGRIRCTAPFNTNSGKMFQVTVSLYGSYTCHTYVVSAYMYSTTNQWHSPKAIYTGTGSPDIVVGRDSSGKAYISIANGNYMGVRVHNMTRGYQTSVADTYDPWTITVNAATENSVTPTVSKVWHSTNDGPGSGLDADLLDAQEGSYYLNYNNFTNTPTIPTNNNQLTNGAGYITASNSAITNKLPIAGGTMTGALTLSINGTDALNFSANSTNDARGISFNGRTAVSADYNDGWLRLNNQAEFSNGIYTPGNFRADGQVYIGQNLYHEGDTDTRLEFGTNRVRLFAGGVEKFDSNNTYWHTGNDGPGSGLDADLLDGFNLTGGSGSIGERVFNNQGRNHSTQTNFNDTSLRAGVNYLQGGTNGPTGTAGHQFYGFRLGLGNDYGTQTGQSGHYASELYWARQSQGGGGYLWARDMESGSWQSWRKMYAGYADSAGSATSAGNADTVDSLHASSFLRSDTTNSLYRVTAGDGNKLRFWDSDSYAIWMSATGNGTWGGRLDSTSDYNMYFRMTGGTNRGFVFQNSTNEVFQIESNGKLRLGTNNTSNYIDASGGAYVHMGSQYGYGYMTPGNSSWCHFDTDRPSFYFGSPVSFDFGITDYSGNWTLNDSGLYFDGNTSRRIQGETLNSNNSVSIYGNWDRFDCMGRVLDWSTSNLHFGDGYNGVNHSGEYFQIGSIGYFRVGGDIYADGNVIAYYSDARLKQKVETIPNALEIINGIRGVTFEWNKKSEEVWSKKEGDKDFGLISQEVEAVFPMGVAVQAGSDRNIEMGFGDPDSPNYDPLHNNPNDEYEYKTVKYDKIVAIAIQAIKEQQEVIEKMQSKINELENKLNGN